MIDGNEVKLGGKVAGSTLVALTDNSAVLRNSAGRLTTLKMFAATEKTRPAPPNTANGAKNQDQQKRK